MQTCQFVGHSYVARIAILLTLVLSQGSVLVLNDPVFSVHRGIFRLLAEFQLENKDNPSYTGKTHSVLHVVIFCAVSQIFPNSLCFTLVRTGHSSNASFYDLCSGLSFQDFYQRCREAFLVNSDITLRTQLTEFRDHKLIRTKKVNQYTYCSEFGCHSMCRK